MSEPSLPLQKFIRSRLIEDNDLLALVAEEHVLDRNGRPEVYPSIIIGEGQTAFSDFHTVVHADLHVWAEEPGLVKAKAIGGAVITALEDCPWHVTGWFVSDFSIRSARYLRGPAGYSHGVLSFAAVMQRRAA